MSRGFRPVFLISLILGFTGCVVISSCTLTATRPVQDMSDTSAAIRAAREVQADTLAPELFRQASEWWGKARSSYKLKDFYYAQQYAVRARKYAEEAEFEAIKNGGNRTDVNPVDQALQPPTPAATPTPQPYPTPEGTPADVYDQRKAADDARRAAQRKADQQEENNAFQGIGIQQGPMISPPPMYNPYGGLGAPVGGATTKPTTTAP